MKKIYILLISVSFLAIGCDDPVNIPLKSVDPILNVDAWLTNTADTQKVTLTYSRPYFDNNLPSPVLGATVTVGETETGKVYSFTDEDGNGIYEWTPPSGGSFGKIGNSFGLQIELADGKIFQSLSKMDSVPGIDSITFEYNKKAVGFKEDWYYGEFWSRDLPGLGNTYWIKAFKNGKFMNKPEEINISYDAGGSAGSEIDGLVFIQPIRIAVNDFGEGSNDPSPYTFGDELRVEIHAVSQDAWFFLSRVIDETSRQPGFAQLFANPLANSPTNIVPQNDSDQVIGFFSVASVSSYQTIMSKENVVDRVPD